MTNVEQELQNLPAESLSPIYLIGICDKYRESLNIRALSNTGQIFDLSKQDIIGLKTHHVSFVYPIISNTLFFIFLLNQEYILEHTEEKSILVVIRNPTGGEFGRITLEAAAMGDGDKLELKYILTGISIANAVYSEPGKYSFYLLKSAGLEVEIGKVSLIYQAALPLNEERIQAIKADPLAAKYLRMILSCKHCQDGIKVFCGIDKKEEKGYIWYQDLPESFICKCGKLNQNLIYIKESLQGFLGYKDNKLSDVAVMERMYSYSALETTVRLFSELISKDKTTEEEIQKFIEKNEVLLSCFTPELLKYKSPINSFYKNDFTILNQKRELLLIEIERANLPLFTKKGVPSAPLTQSFSQVEDWLTRANRNRLSVLDDIKMEGLSIDRVTNIKGVVIAGRKKDINPPLLEKLFTRNKNIDFYTYDDLLASLVRTIETIKNI